MAKISETRPGTVHGRLTVLGQYRKSGRVYCICACECGTVKSICCQSLGGLTNSCGCLQGLGNWHTSPELGLPANTKRLHRLTERERLNLSDGKVRAYRSWSNMWQRTTHPSKADKAKYQKMSPPPDRWLDFDNFFTDMGECPQGMTLDRKDTRAGYSPSNCKWATRAEQVINRECVVFYTNGTEVLNLTALAAQVHCSPTTLRAWAKKGRYPEGWRIIPYAEALPYLHP